MKKEQPKLNKLGVSKVVVSSGLGRLRLNNAQFEEKLLPEIAKELAAIVGQKPEINRAKKSIAGFKVREGEVVGITATLRGKRMKDFLTKLTSAVLPRVRDFRGVSANHLDKNGNLNIGFKDQYVFPEINPEMSKANFGIEVTLVSNIKDREKAIEFYRGLGIPLTIA